MTVPVGSIVYLTSCIIKAKITAETTMPDTPNMYGAELEVMDDRGAMDVSAIAGKKGPDGQVNFVFRRQDDIEVTNAAQLPTGLTDSDIGKYWVISTRDSQGTITEQWAWVWYGTGYTDPAERGILGARPGWRATYMGAEGPPGPLPRIRPSVSLISPGSDSFVDTTGTTLAPSWRFNLGVAAGPSGPVSKLHDMPDYDNSPPPDQGNILMCSGDVTTAGDPIWRPANVMALSPRAYSIPESAFSSHTATFSSITSDEHVNIAQFALPAQPFDWTPVVWGHIGGTYRSTPFPSVLPNPFTLVNLLLQSPTIIGAAITGLNPNQRIGCRVLLGEKRTQLARGFGNGRGQVNVMPHYSTPGRPNRNITPSNTHAVIKAGQTDTLYIDLHNDGAFGMFNFDRTNSQMLVMVVPINPYSSYTTRRVS